MKRTFLTLTLCLLIGVLHAEAWHTHAIDNHIRTLQVRLEGDELALPVVELDGDQRLLISFDEMSYEPQSYNFKIVHCNADWTTSSLSDVEFIDGFYDGIIGDYTLATNTTALYTHYWFSVPNDDLRLKVSGNYAVLIAKNNDFDHLSAVACFSVVESLVGVTGSVRGNTDIELVRRYQQLDFELNTSGYEVRDPFSELKVTVQQNRRTDNAVTNLKPTYTSLNTQSYKNNRSLIFEGGNQYRSVDFSSEYTYGEGIERIVFEQSDFQVLLSPEGPRAQRGLTQGDDADGNYLINRQNSDDSDSEGDYMWVHFMLPMDDPFFEGGVYILGDMMSNQLDTTSRMEYNFNLKAYTKSLYLKQGGYNFQYIYLQKGEKKGSLQPIEGSFWQTENEYTIYVYHRPWGERYDKLVAVKTINS